MRQDVIEKHFGKIGARAVVGEGLLRGRAERPRVDIRRIDGKEGFVIDVGEGKDEIAIIEARPDIKHLLLMIKDPAQDPAILKYLCGHDERHWFAAAVPEYAHAKNVEDALQALKPAEAMQAQKSKGLRKKNRHKRHNKAWKRQGEWFFVPDSIDPGKSPIHRNEPIVRGRGKAHMCEELFRQGGTVVYVNSRYAPNGISKKEYEKLIDAQPRAAHLPWRTMVRDASVYVRGRITHPDHATVVLPSWHRVLPNNEDKAAAMQHVAFLD